MSIHRLFDWLDSKIVNMDNKKQDRKKRIWLIAGCLILAVSGFFAWKVWSVSYDGGVTAKVYQDGKLLYSFSLQKEGEAREFLVENENGGSNTIRVSKEGISVSEADCPDQICVKRGTVYYSEIPIVCMPNRLVIEFEKDGEEGEIDGGISYGDKQ